MNGDTLYWWRGICCWVSSVCLVTILHFALVQCLFFCTVCLNLVSLVHCCWLVHGKACCVYLTVNGLTWCIVSTFYTEVLTLPGNVIFSAACKPASDTQKKGLDNQTRCQFHCRETTLLTPCIIFLWIYFWLFFLFWYCSLSGFPLYMYVQTTKYLSCCKTKTGLQNVRV